MFQGHNGLKVHINSSRKVTQITSSPSCADKAPTKAKIKAMDKAARRPARRRILRPKWQRVLWRIILALLLLLIITGVAGFVLYLNRNVAYETVIKRALSERGYDAGLTVESATTERAVIKNITLAKKGDRFVAADRLTLTYNWNEVFDGRLKTVTLDGLDLSVVIDKSGKIISDWMLPPSGSPLILPREGITVNDANLKVASPYGALIVQGNVSAKSLTDLTANIRFDSQSLSVGPYSAGVAGKLSAKRSGSDVTLSASEIDLSGITGPDGPIASANIKMTGDVGLPGDDHILTYAGKANIAAAAFNGPFFNSRRSVLGFDGALGYNVETQKILPSAFDLQASLGDLSLTDPKLRSNLAQRITLEKTLATTPVAGLFVSDITAEVEGLLAGADWDAGVSVDYRDNGYAINLKGPLSLKNKKSSIVLRPAGSGSEFVFDKRTRALTLKSRIDISGARSLRLDNFILRGLTDNGYLWTQIDAVTGTARSAQTWREGDSVRLAPFKAGINYRGGTYSDLSIKTALDYDGPLLGNDFIGLDASGVLTLSQVRGGFDLSFDSAQILKAQSVVTPFGYAAKDLSLTLLPGAPLLNRRGGEDKLTLNTAGITADIFDTGSEARYKVAASEARVTGVRGAGIETYAIDAGDLNVTSDTMPGPGSRLKAPQLSAKLIRAPGADLQFSVSSPAVRAKAGSVTLKDVGIDVSGTPDAVKLAYEGGTIMLDGTNLPPLPVSGKAVFADKRLSGEAQTALPGAPRFPIYLDYDYANGQGSAALDIPKFVFSPGGVQPQSLVPGLKGKIAAVEGVASVKAQIGFKPGQPITSKGTVSISSMDIGTLVGPLTGVAADLEFDSLYPLRSSGMQSVTMDGFDPGIPLGEGSVSFTVVKDGFDLIDARWPMGSGEIAVRPTFWSTAGAINEVTVDVRDISLGDLIARFGNKDLSATGKINGTLPVIIDGVNLKVSGGTLAIKEGGVISVKTKQLDRAGELNETAKIAVDALKNFNYEELSLSLDGPLDGDMKLGAIFTGSNPKVLGGADFLFRTNIEGELANIARNLASATQMQNIKKSITQKVEAQKKAEAAE